MYKMEGLKVKTWKVVPLCEKQLRDVNPSDILNNGLYRRCNVYKSGGGYDLFPTITEKLFGKNLSNQFVVQLFGCNLNCPYCYVTRDGVFGEWVEVSTPKLIEDFALSKQEVFHLMGGAPALYLDSWIDILKKLPNDKVFTSDLMLSEGEYSAETLAELAKFQNAIFAVNIKGLTEEEYPGNTGTVMDEKLILSNLYKVKVSGVKFYITFTNCSKEIISSFIKDNKLKGVEYFSIDLIDYEALK